jgi:1-deoxy-D-xylulose-5-phosphate synthase
MRFVKPIDEDLIDRIASKNHSLITLEENAIAGGAGSAVAEVLSAQGHRVSLLQIGIPDRPIAHGSRDDSLAEAGLDFASLQSQINAWWRPRLPPCWRKHPRRWCSTISTGRTAPPSCKCPPAERLG